MHLFPAEYKKEVIPNGEKTGVLALSLGLGYHQSGGLHSSRATEAISKLDFSREAETVHKSHLSVLLGSPSPMYYLDVFFNPLIASDSFTHYPTYFE